MVITPTASISSCLGPPWSENTAYEYDHNIIFLRDLAEQREPRLFDVWPRGKRWERATYQKLKEAYRKARYSKHYQIDEEELEWLSQRIEELGRRVHDICSERIAALAKRAGIVE